MVAAIIGGWLAYKTISASGPTITITFKDASGLVAGKTKIKYKSVVLGKVEKIEIKDLHSVTVTARIDKSGARFMTKSTKFWVVRPRIGGSEISGLETIVSGAYISIDPRPGPSARTFTGLEKPPGVLVDEEGTRFKLRAADLGSAFPGTPILHRGIKVGRVVDYKLAKDDSGVIIDIFIKAPYNLLVRDTSRFWQVTGIDVSYGIGGLAVNVQSLATLIAGGIAFDTPVTAAGSNKPVKPGTICRLFKNFKSIDESKYVRKVPYLLHFSESLRGLRVGAPVEFRGIKVGYVTDIAIAVNPKTMNIDTPVVIELEPERLAASGFLATHKPRELTALMVRRGLRAQLKMGSLLTGQLFVELNFHSGLPAKTLLIGGKYPGIPTIPSTTDELRRNAAGVLAKIQGIPFDKIGRGLLKTIQGAKRFTNSPELLEAVHTLNTTLSEIHALTRTGGSLNKSFNNLDALTRHLDTRVVKLDDSIEKTLTAVRAAMEIADPNSPTAVNLTTALDELSAAARSVRGLADYLERHPEALLHGKGREKR
ncbi:MAG: MCE family protein, partial [Deltaproteobacteria bacterium]|nr:MCE family protein [Deltaproteobacteria bacterium]